MAEIIKTIDLGMFEKILSGEKNFEIMLNNQRYEVGDVFILKEIDERGNFTGREIKKTITFLLKTKELPYWKQEDINKYGYVILSLE